MLNIVPANPEKVSKVTEKLLAPQRNRAIHAGNSASRKGLDQESANVGFDPSSCPD